MALLASLVTGCSLIQTTYNNAPVLTIFWLDDYFSFTQAQNLALKPALQKLHQWHRQTQLSPYIKLLKTMQTSFANQQISAEDVCGKLDEVKLKIYTLQLESIPIIVEMAPQLSAKQLTRFQTKLAERAEKWKTDFWQETKQEQVAERLEKAEDFAEKIYGSLSDAQLILLKQRLTESNINPAISFKEIERRHADALSIVNDLQSATLSRDEKIQMVKAGFDRIQTSPDQTYQTYVKALTNQTCQTLSDLHASTNEKQKLHAKNWLDDYITQITALQR